MGITPRSRSQQLVAVGLLVIVSGCLLVWSTTRTTSHPTSVTTVAGQLVAIGATRPTPIPGSVTLRSTDGRVTLTVDTGSDGHFRAVVVPGTYSVSGQSPQLHWPTGVCRGPELTATRDVTVRVIVSCQGA